MYHNVIKKESLYFIKMSWNDPGISEHITRSLAVYLMAATDT